MKKSVQATKRTIRLRRWKVEVLRDEAPQKIDYTVIAAVPIDARIIAFTLDRGFPTSMVEMKEEDIALVETHTKILEVSRG